MQWNWGSSPSLWKESRSAPVLTHRGEPQQQMCNSLLNLVANQHRCLCLFHLILSSETKHWIRTLRGSSRICDHCVKNVGQHIQVQSFLRDQSCCSKGAELWTSPIPNTRKCVKVAELKLFVQAPFSVARWSPQYGLLGWASKISLIYFELHPDFITMPPSILVWVWPSEQWNQAAVFYFHSLLFITGANVFGAPCWFTV